jgi:hypothetical protein
MPRQMSRRLDRRRQAAEPLTQLADLDVQPL